MTNLEKRIRELEEMVFTIILETKAETMALRDILIEKNIVSSEHWKQVVNRHKTSYDSFKIVRDMERRINPTSGPLLAEDESKAKVNRHDAPRESLNGEHEP